MILQYNLLIILNIYSLSIKLDQKHMNHTSSQFNWNDLTISKSFIKTSVGTVPLITYLPEDGQNSKAIFAIHYQEGRKEIWLEEENYSSILNYAIENRIPFYAVDLYGHGEWKSDDENFNPEYLDDDQWDLFVKSSVDGIKETITSVAKDKEIIFISNSTGCLIATKVMASNVYTSGLIMASPVPAKSYDDEYSLHNNTDALKNKKILILSGKKDEEVEEGEVLWYYNLIESDKKEIELFESGHELPKEWINRSIKFLNSL